MLEELIVFMCHGTWELVFPPNNCKVVGYNWVFHVKHKVDGSIDRFKARLVTKGYNQRPMLDYKETFSFIVKLAIIKIILKVVMMQEWPLR